MSGSIALLLALLPATRVQLGPSSVASPGEAQDERHPVQFLGEGRHVDEPAFGTDSITPAGPAARRVEWGGESAVAPDESDPYFLGFTAGRYYPDAAERLDPRLVSGETFAPAGGRPSDATWGYALLERRLQPEDVAAIESRGARVLSLFPHQALVLRLPVGTAAQVADLEAVRWVGLPRAWQKIAPSLAARLDAPLNDPATGDVDLYVNVFESDLGDASTKVTYGSAFESDPGSPSRLAGPESRPSRWRTNGWQEQALESRGARMRSWNESIRAFRLTLPASRVREVAALDFVCFVELDVPARTLHEESIPMIAADLTREDYGGGVSGLVNVGIVDSGMQTSHPALNHLFSVGWDFSGDFLQDPFFDLCDHGSHVAGTILGNGSVEPTYRGVAPDVSGTALTRVYVAKIFDSFCNGGVDLDSLFSRMHTVHIDNDGFPTLPPSVINHSWSTDATPLGWFGSEAAPRAFDQETYDHRQLHVFAAGNDGPGASTISLEGSAKNVLTVGNVVPWPTGQNAQIDPGVVANGSSRGPCGDGRFKPNVCAPGTGILSVDSLSASGYTMKTGTSMATPHVVGLAAQLMDHYPNLKSEPQAVSALLMAAAISRSEATVNTPSTGAGDHLSTYGAGRVEAHRSHWADADSATFTWYFDVNPVGWQELDFTVGAGAQRIVSVMTYLEPASSAGASQALLADLNSWIDVEPFAAGGASGDFFGHMSPVDNVEIATLTNPAAGNYRIKVVPTTAFLFPRRVGVCVMVDYGATHPNADLQVFAESPCVLTDQVVGVTTELTSPSFVSSAAYAWLLSGTYTIVDVTTDMPGPGIASHLDNPFSGQGVMLGDVVHGTSRRATWWLKWSSDGPKQVKFFTQSENTDSLGAEVEVIVDGQPPTAPLNLNSPTHPAGVWSNEPTIIYEWDSAVDEASDIAGYSHRSGVAPGIPDQVPELPGNATTTNEDAFESDGTWFFSIRAVDECGNWGAHATHGPVMCDLTRPFGPGALSSSSHTPGLPSAQTVVQLTWQTATDNLSGVAGYRVDWTQSAIAPDTGAINLGPNATGTSQLLAISEEPWYVHVQAVDEAGNRGEPATFGPLLIYGPAGTPFCFGDGSGTACPCSNNGSGQRGCGNSVTANGAGLTTGGVASLSQDDVTLNAAGMPNGMSLFFQGTVRNAGGAGAVLGDGLLCAGGSIIRLAIKTNQNGSAEYPEASDPAIHVAGQVALPGEVRTYQVWYRDPQAACSGAGYNLTNGMEVTWMP